MTQANRVYVKTETKGQGTVTLGAVVSQAFCTFAEAGVANGASIESYIIEAGQDFEIGVGIYNAGTLTRATVRLSRINGVVGTSKMVLIGNATVRVTVAAEDIANLVTDAEMEAALDLRAPEANVFMYGAVGDGVTDDSAAFTAALATGVDVFVPWTANGYVVGDIILNSAHRSLTSNGARLVTKAGADSFFKISGFKNRVSGFYMDDTAGLLVSQTTIASGGTLGSTSIVVASASNGPGIQLYQRIAVRLDSGSWFTTWVSSVAGTTVGLADALPSASTAGRAVWTTFGGIWCVNALYPTVENIHMNGVWGGLLLDDPAPSTQGGVTKGTFRNIRFSSSRFFGFIKGRNCGDNNFQNVHGRGSYNASLAQTGDGATTTFTLSDQVFLQTEIVVKVNGVTKALTTDYTISSDGLSFTFVSAPANGAAITATWPVYGLDGNVEDARNTATVSGGNVYNNISFLGYRRGGVYQNAQLPMASDVIYDTCSEAAMVLDATTQVLQWQNLYLGYAPKLLVVKNNSIGAKIFSTMIYPLSAGLQASGAAGSTGPDVASGSEFVGRFYNRTGGWTDYVGQGAVALDVDSAGNVSWGGTTKIAKWTFNGTAGSLSLNSAGDVFAFGKSGFTYLNNSGANGQLVLQASGANGVVQMDGKITARMAVNGVDKLVATATAVTVTGAKVVAAAPTTSLASLSLPAGTAPTSPVDGDVWREDNTNTGLKVRINGVTKTITVS